jgi:hypothetical protein
MNKITATTYETNVPKRVASLADEAWKARDQEVWANNIQEGF